MALCRNCQSKVELTPELANFVGWYQAMVKDASPEVQAVMKKFDPRFRSGSANRNEEIEQWYPTDEWMQRLLDMGIVIDDYRSYTGYLSRRWLFYHAENDPEELADMKDFYDLDSDASWDQVLNAGIHFGVKLRTHANQAMDADPQVYGGQLSKDGVFIPFRYKTVYVKNNFILKGAGVPDWVSQELTNRGHGVAPEREIPKDIDVIYLDEKGQPRENANSSGDAGETPTVPRSESNVFEQPASEKSVLLDEFDNSDFDDMPTTENRQKPETKPPVDFPTTPADLEKQLTPEGIEAELTEGISPDRFDKKQQSIDQLGTEEGLRRPKEINKEGVQPEGSTTPPE